MRSNSLAKKDNHKLRLSGPFFAVIAAALLLGASFGVQSAFAVMKTPNYKIAVSNPAAAGCTFSGINKACVERNVNGLAETWVKDNRAGAHWAQVYHEMNPTSPGTPSAGFIFTDDALTNSAHFTSELHGNGEIDKNGLTAEARYGGNVFKLNGGSWQFQNWFYVAKTTDGTFTIPNDTEVKYCINNVAAGSQWTMGSLFESLTHGGGFGGLQQADSNVYGDTKQWNSEHLEVTGFCGI